MSPRLPRIYLARHGETAWSLGGRHTGRCDVPLTEPGEREAQCLGSRLELLSFAAVFTSPLQRARRTCELAGFGNVAQKDVDLMEWDYGSYEGLTRAAILEKQPDWVVFRDGCPEGERPDDVRRRAERAVTRLRSQGGDVLVFSHGHFLRVLAAVWLGLPLEEGRHWMLGTAALSILGYDHNSSEPAIHLWNDDHHLNRGPTLEPHR